jgi:hypothetical protein
MLVSSLELLVLVPPYHHSVAFVLLVLDLVDGKREA